MSEMKVGSIVESMTSEGALTVKILGKNQVVAQDETGKLEVYPPDELYVVPGDDYCRLRRTVIDTMDKVTKDLGRNNMNSTRYQLALSRALYADGVRRGEEDLVNHIQQGIKIVIQDSIAHGDIAAAIKRNMQTQPVFTPAGDMPDGPCMVEEEPVPVKPGEDPMVLQHTDLTGHSETLVQQLTDDELVKMCVDVATMLAGFTGFMMLSPQDHVGLSELQKTVITYENARNLRMKQVWEMAKKVVGHCRMAEVGDAVENMLEAIRQQEEPDEE
jgi:hypothetical protein